jgi:hypothetical protein
MITEIRKELVDFIVKETLLDRETVIKVLRAEEAFIMVQIQKAIERENRST